MSKRTKHGMEGYTNLGGNHQDFDDLDIERKHSDESKRDDGKRAAKDEPQPPPDAEQQRLLQLKVPLSGGGYGHVFSLRVRDGAVRWSCHLCDVVIVGQAHVETHIQSKKHQVRACLPAHERAGFPRIEGEDSGMEVADGQPVPPGFEDSAVPQKGVPQIQATLDCHKSSPLIGLEYLIELIPDERDTEPMYVCVLCDKRGDPRVTMAHLTSYNHSSKYIGINFPTANRAINSSLPRTKQGRKGGASLVTKICSMIEEKHGRLSPLVLRQEIYDAKKEYYHRQIEYGRHFRESATDNFMDFVAKDCLRPFSINLDEVPLPDKEPPPSEDPKRKIAVDRSRLRSHATKDNDKKNMKNEADSTSDKKPSDNRNKGKKERDPRRNSLSSISSVSSSSLSRSPSPARTRSKSKTPSSPSPPPAAPRIRDRRSNDRSNRNTAANRFRNRSRSRSPARFGRRRTRSRSTSRTRQRSRGNNARRSSPARNKSGASSAVTEWARWEKFRSDSDKIERELTKTLRFHEKNPEKHPMYPEEWKKFWNVRYKELQAEGKDPSSHDFKPEWIKFWDKRMKEMHEEDFKLKKEELKVKLKLPRDEPTQTAYVKRPRLQAADDDIIVISPGPGSSRDAYQKSSWKNKTDSRERKRSLSPWDKDDAYRTSKAGWSSNNVRYPDQGRDRTVSFGPPPPRPPYMEEDLSDPEPEGGARVVTVVRLLTALESQLGSFGPAVNQLLASALTMEKKRPGSSESMLANPDNLVFFETVKEKLKGQLFAGIVEHGLVMATKASIQNLADMLFRAEKMSSSVPLAAVKPAQKPVVLPVHAEPVSVPGVGAMEKQAIATQIAAALVAEGRANVTQEELESLINAVIGMAKASASLDKPITTAAFVSRLQGGDTTAPPAVAATPPQQVKETSSLETLLNVVHSKPAVTVKAASPVMAAAKPAVEEVYKAPIGTCLFPCTIEREEPAERERTPTPPPTRVNKASLSIEDMNMEEMEELTEGDLKALLQNFKDLSTKEQYCLITYLKKIEATEPDRVENLRQFVNLPPSQVDAPAAAADSESCRPLSPFSLRLGRSNPTLDDSSRRYRDEPDASDEKLKLDDSDDDYSFEDIYEAASKRVNEKEKAAKELELKQASDASQSSNFELVGGGDKATPEATESKELAYTSDSGNVMREADMLIANLMGNLPEKYVKKRTPTPSPSTAKPSTPLNIELPTRPNVGLNIDISNTLVDAANDFIPNAGLKSAGNVGGHASNIGTKISPVVAIDSGQMMHPQYEESANMNNLYDPSIPTGNNFSDPYGQQAFHNGQFPGNLNQPNFPNGPQGYPQEFVQGGYPPQQFPQQGYPGNYGGNYYGAPAQQPQFAAQQQQHQQQPPHQQQLGNPHQYNAQYQQQQQQHQQQQQMGRGGFPPQGQQGFHQQRAGQPPFRPNMPPQEYPPNQYGGQGYNQYPPQAGYY